MTLVKERLAYKYRLNLVPCSRVNALGRLSFVHCIEQKWANYGPQKPQANNFIISLLSIVVFFEKR